MTLSQQMFAEVYPEYFPSANYHAYQRGMFAAILARVDHRVIYERSPFANEMLWKKSASGRLLPAQILRSSNGNPHAAKNAAVPS